MKCFLTYVRQHLHALALYRFAYITKLIYGLLAMFAVRSLWVALYANQLELDGRSLMEMITYAMAAMALDLIFYPQGENSVHTYMSHQVRTGNIDTDLLRPMGFQRQMLYRNAGYMIVTFVSLVLPAVFAGMLFMGFRPPADILSGLLFALSLVMAYFVLFSLNFLLGLVTMLIKNTFYIVWAYRGLSDFFSGKLVPIWIFPAGLRTVSGFMPFRCIYDIPLNIYIGALTGSECARALLFQLFWAVSLMLLGQILWRAVHRRYTVQGG